MTTQGADSSSPGPLRRLFKNARRGSGSSAWATSGLPLVELFARAADSRCSAWDIDSSKVERLQAGESTPSGTSPVNKVRTLGDGGHFARRPPTSAWLAEVDAILILCADSAGEASRSSDLDGPSSRPGGRSAAISGPVSL